MATPGLNLQQVHGRTIAVMLRQTKAGDIGAAGGEVWRSAIENAFVQSSLFRTPDG
jgi:hypothetical protein